MTIERKLILIFSLLLICKLVQGQNLAWTNYNDSIFKITINHYTEYCESLNSSNKIKKRKIKADIKLIDIANHFYEVSTERELQTIKTQFKHITTEGAIKKFDWSISFSPISEGNLRIRFNAEIKNNEIIRRQIILGTNSKTGCKEKNECCLSYFDFVYVEDYLLKFINFPLFLKPNTTEIIITRLN